MAEVGLVRFAHVTMQLADTTVPRFRSKFSKRQFTQPQLLAVLCLMRYEDWTFREAEVRLAEHAELRRALRLTTVPDHTTLYRFLRRLDPTCITRLLRKTARRVAGRGKSLAAVDGTGLTSGAVSTFFVHRVRDAHPGGSWRHWLKWLVAVDIPHRVILAQEAKQEPTNDGARLRPLCTAAHAVLPLHTVLADAEFDSELNHQHIRGVLGADSIIPAKRGKPTWRLHGVRAVMRRRFPRRRYRQRAIIESIFSAVKRKLSSRAPGRTVATQVLQALVLGLSYNLYRVRRPFRHEEFFALGSPA